MKRSLIAAAVAAIAAPAAVESGWGTAKLTGAGHDVAHDADIYDSGVNAKGAGNANAHAVAKRAGAR